MITARRIIRPEKSHGAETCDVLSVISGVDDQWRDSRGTRLGAWLAERGVSHGHCAVSSAEWLIEEIRSRGVRVVISEAFSISPPVMSKLAVALPGVRMIHLFHGAPAWVVSSSPGAVYGAIRQSRDLPNVYVGTVSDPAMMAWPTGAKIIHLPNPVEIPKSGKAEKLKSETLCVSLIARSGPIKNWGGMVACLGILSRRRPVRSLVVGRGNDQNRCHLDYVSDLGVQVESRDFTAWADTLAIVAAQVDVGLACGFSDALNLIAAEHCLLGIPVVGSPATDWLPERWRVNPQDPVAMADLVEAHASDPKAGAAGKKIAAALAKANEKTLLKNLKNLLKP